MATVYSRMRRISPAAEWRCSVLVERSSMRAVAEEGMELTDVCQSAAEKKDGIRGAGVGPGVAAGAVDRDAEAKASEGASHDGGGSATFEGNGSGDAATIGASLEEIAHAAEVAFALFAYVGGEEDSGGRVDAGIAE
jgi:hypothetical protein